MDTENLTPEQIAERVRQGIVALQQMERTDLLLSAIGVPLLEELRTEAAKGTLSPLLITRDYRFVLTALQREVELTPVHKAVYLLFLNHPEGIAFKQLSDYKAELLQIYARVVGHNDTDIMAETVSRLVNPLDNAINEKCSRIKNAFSALMDEYSASYYIISGHKKRTVPNGAKLWFQRLKVITLPRHLVVYEQPKTGD